MSGNLISTRNVSVEWGDCDPADIVFYPNFFRWFDASTAHHFTAAGLSKNELRTRLNVVGFPMRTTRADFHAPAAYGEVVTIETEFVRFGRSSFDVEHRLKRGDTLCVEGFETRVLVQRDETGKLVPYAMPDNIKALFRTGG
ncbi:MAG: acyl-CoA thioesterase [Paracoccaceae bacterium]